VSKPSYRVPLMAEIAAVAHNGYKMVSTFSGCGGSCLGFKMAGFEVLWASEFVEAAQEVYRLNHPETVLDTRDIREVTAEEIMSAIKLPKGELDVFEGSPPCAAFSSAGIRSEGWGEVKQYSSKKQRVDDLFFEYARLLEGLMPRVFVAENVKGLVRGVARGYFKEIVNKLSTVGYNVEVKLLDARWLGVPQQRERLIFMGVRKDLKKRPVFPAPLPYQYSMGEALEGLDHTEEEVQDAWHLDPQGVMSQIWRRTKPGEYLSEGSKRLRGKDAFFSHRKLSPSTPASTITQTAPNVYHWEHPRSLTAKELRRASGFPDDFKLTGTFGEKWERIGRAVPPVMMAAVARAVKGILDEVKG